MIDETLAPGIEIDSIRERAGENRPVVEETKVAQ